MYQAVCTWAFWLKKTTAINCTAFVKCCAFHDYFFKEFKVLVQPGIFYLTTAKPIFQYKGNTQRYFDANLPKFY